MKKQADHICQLPVFILYRRRDSVVPGGADEHGCIQLHQPPPADGDEGAGQGPVGGHSNGLLLGARAGADGAGAEGAAARPHQSTTRSDSDETKISLRSQFSCGV